MKKNCYISVLYGIIACFQIQSEQNVVLTFKTYPQTVTPEKPYSIISKPQKSAQILLQNHLGSTGGILGILNGQASFSTNDGQMYLERGTVDDTLNILVTESLTPIIYHGNTVANWYIPNQQASALYRAQRVQNTETNAYNWEISETVLPEDGMIPANTIILFGNISNILIPTGIFGTHEDPHLVLPHFYVKPKFTVPGVYLKYLKHSRLYHHVKKVYKDAQSSVSSLIEG